MKTKLTLLIFALFTTMGAWATDVTWESLHGWTQSSGGVGNFKWYGVHTPGDNTITYTMSSIQLKQCSGGDNNTNYLAIATVSPSSNSTIAENNVLAVSSNSIKATASALYEYTFSPSVTLTGGTTYYLVFVTANTPTDNAYNIQTGRMEVNHLNCYAYTYGNAANVDWFPYFKATLTTTNSTKHYSYSCKNLAGYFLSSGYLLQDTDPTTGDAPSISGYTCQSAAVDETGVIFTYALTSNPLTSATTSASDMATKPKYTTIESVAGGFVYYAEEGGAVKGWSPYDKNGDDAHWIIVGDEANGYKLYNALTGTSKVAVVANDNGAAIQMKDEASNTASLFDIRYISGAHRLYKKGTKWCTNRLSSSTRLMGIHTNVNDGSKADVSRYSKTITYKLKWNNSEIASESVSVPTGDATSDHLPSTWNRAYCNYTYDVSYVTTETSTVNVTMNWDGPFEFSTDFASAKWYYMTVGGEYAVADGTTNCPTYADKQFDESALWAFIGNPYDGFKIANYSTGSSNFLSLGSPVQMNSDQWYKLCFAEKSDNKLYIYNDPNEPYYLILSGHVLGAGDRNITYSAITVEPYIVTYNLKFGGSTIATKTLDKVTGDSKDLLPSEWERDFCTYSYEPAEIGNSTTSVDVTMTWSGPFEFSTDYANAKWYYIAVNSKWAKNNNWVSPNISSDIETVKGLDDGQWAFIGNPYDGITLMLKAKYDKTWEMYLSASVSNPALTYVIESTEKWSVKRLTPTTFTLNCGDKYLVDNTSNMAFKTTDLVGNEGTFSVRSYYCQQALDNWTTYVGESTDKLFGVRPESVALMEETILGMPKMTETEYNSYFATIPNANIGGYISYNQPTSGRYYRIKNNGTGDYIAYGQPVAAYNDKTAGLIAISSDNAATDASSVIKLTGSAGTYKLSTEGLNVQSQTTGSQAFPATDSEGVNFVFNVATPGVVSITNAASRVDDNNDGSLHNATGWTVNGVVNWKASADNSKWVIEDAESITLTLNAVDGKTYGTTYLPFGVTLPTGENDGNDVCAYTLTDNNNGWLTLHLLGTDGKSIPANTPVLLRGTSTTSVTATIADVDAIDTGSNALSGTCVSIEHGDNLVLGKIDNVVGFYKYNFDIKANKAYIDGSAGVKGFKLMLDDEETAIENVNVNVNDNNAIIYNVAGQRLNKIQKGINIVNGKKVLK